MSSALASTAQPFFEPFRIGAVELKNRIVMSPMTREFSPGGVPGSDVASYYARRARGGVGLIITEGVGIGCAMAVDNQSIPHMYGDAALAGWREVVAQVHEAGAKIFPQLWHQGPLRDPLISAFPELIGHRPSGLWGTPGVTSCTEEYVARILPATRAMTQNEIDEVIGHYVDAARNAKTIGFDGIAIHGGHGYLIDSFLWPETNQRNDKYGGSAEKRARFGAEVVSAIRAEIGADMPIMFRFSQHKQQDYKARFAQSPEELGTILTALAQAGVDVFDASSRRFNMPVFEGSDITLSGLAKQLTGKPSMTVGGVGLNNWLQDTFKGRGETLAVDNLGEVRKLFDRDMFDLVAVGRALLSDAEWATKARNSERFLPFDKSAITTLF